MSPGHDFPLTSTVASDVEVLALRSPTLPPATSTNTVFLGERPLVVDPGSSYPAERETLLAVIGAFIRRGRIPSAIVLTHHHRDHVGAATWLKEETGLPVLAHPRTAALLEGEIAVDAPIQAGDQLEQWTVLHTPGHASGHVVLHDASRGILVAGDMVASAGTIIIDPPDGHMASYLDSLRKLRDLGARVIIPSHGPPIVGVDLVRAHFSHYLAHREARELMVLSALSDEARDLGGITRRAYPELAPGLLMLACRSALAHLEKLVEEGKAVATAEGWRAASRETSGGVLVTSRTRFPHTR